MTSKPVDTAIVMVVGPCIDDTDAKTLEEAIAYNAAGMDISLIVEKTDGTSAVTAITLTTGGTSDWTHKDGGYYEVEITAAQNAEEGIAFLRGVCTGVLPFESAHYDIVKANIYDSLIKGTDRLQIDVTQLLGTAWLAPGVAGTPDVNAKLIGATAQTGRDIGASVLLSTGTGAGQLDFTSGIVKSNLSQILSHLLTQTGTQLADGFEHFFDVATPTGTLDSLPAAAPNAAGGLPVSAAGGLDLDTKLANTNEITVARMGALTDWINGGRLDNLLDAIPTTAMRGTDNATLAATWTDARAGYLDNLSAGAVALASGVDLTSIHGAALTETVNGYLAAAFVKLFDVATPLLVSSEVMRGTDSAALATTALTSATWTNTRAGYLDELAAANLPTDVANVKTDTAAILTDTGTDGVLLAATATSAQLVDDVWDEVLTGALHNIVNSAGRRVRETGAYAVESGTAQAGDAYSITLAATASATDGVYNRNLVVLVDNTGVGQTRTIVDYDGTSKVAVIDRDWRVTPDNTTVYQVTADNTPLVVDQGVAQSGTSTTIKLRAYASSTNDIYLCNVVAIIAGTGRGQARLVGSYDGTSKIATICGDNWVTNPDNTSVYVLMPYGTTCTSCVGTYALGQINTECDTALTDYDPPTNTEMVAAFTEIKGATWAAGTDTLEHIRNKQTDIETDTTEIGIAGAGLTDLGGMSTGMKTEVESEANDALVAVHLDHLLATDYDPASKPGVATALLNELVENDGGVSRYTANALEQAPSGGTNPNVLIDTTISGAPSSQTVFVLAAGSDIDDAYKDQAIVLYDASNNDYPSVRKVSAYTGATKTVTLDSAPDFTIIAGDGVKTFVTAPGTTAPTVGQIRTEMEGVGYFLDLIKADTNELQTDWVNGGRLDLLLDACALEATVAALNNISTLDVNAQVVDVMKTDTVSEMAQGAPPATPTMEQILNYLYRKYRNKTETTSSEDAVYDDAGTTKLVKATISDDTVTFTKGEYVSGA